MRAYAQYIGSLRARWLTSICAVDAFALSTSLAMTWPVNECIVASAPCVQNLKCRRFRGLIWPSMKRLIVF